jgi:acyl-CoA thioesterase I
MKSAFVSAISLSILLAMSACSSDKDDKEGTPPPKNENTVRNAKPGMGTIVILGDSLAAGSGATAPAKVPEFCLADAFPGQAVHNQATPGLTSLQILARVQAVEADQPKLIFVSSAGNDTISDYYKPGSYPAQKTLKEMDEMFDRLLDTGALVVYLGLTPPWPRTERLTEVSDLAKQKGVIVVDGMNGLWKDPAYMADQLHPNNAGYKIMCDRILESIQGFYP